MTDLKLVWVVLVVVLSLLSGACTGPVPTPSVSSWTGQVGPTAATADLGDVLVSFPEGVAAQVTQAAITVDHNAASDAPAGSKLVSPVVRVSLDGGQQPVKPVQITIRLSDASLTAAVSSGQSLLVAAAVSADGTESFTQGSLDTAARTFTFTTDHFSDFKVLGFDVGDAWQQVRTALMEGLGLEIPSPECVDQPATVNGTRYRVVSTAQTYLCVSESGGNLVVTAYPATAMPFRITSDPAATAVTEPTKVSVTNAGLIAFARALALIDRKGIAAAFDGARARLTFAGAPSAVHLSLEQNPGLLLMAILAKTLDVMGIATVEKLQQVEWVQCLSDAHTTSSQFVKAGVDGKTVGSTVQAFLTCAGTVGGLTPWGRVLLAALTAAPTFLVTSVLGIVNQLSGQASYEVLLDVTAPKARIELSEGGWLTFDGTDYGRRGPEEIRALIKKLGQPTQTSAVKCGTNPMTARRWDDLVVYSLHETFQDEASPARWEAGGISGWKWDSSLNAGRNTRAAVKGPRGIDFGTTGATIKSIYAKIDYFSVWNEGNDIVAFAGDTTSVTFRMTGANRVKSIEAGFSCS